MTVRLRSEAPGDEDAIDVVNCRAFHSMEEASIIRLMRDYHPSFDRRFSVTAWDGEELVGHALFSPARIRLMGRTITALALGPIAVLPERQREGIGGQLVRFGHELGKRERFSVAFLFGHPSYYPRHGYQACFGFGKVRIDLHKLAPPAGEFRQLPVRSTDIPWLVARWHEEWADVDFAWLWGKSLTEWTIPCVNAVMWWAEDGRRAAYTLTHGRETKVLLADAPELARDVIAASKLTTLEQHPSGWLARNALDPEWAIVEAKPSQAAMVCELQPGVLASYIQALEANARPPGATTFPLPFIAC